MATVSAFAQETVKHKVVQGESIYSIAKKHGISEEAIYKLNPKVKGKTLQLKTVLLISTNKKTETNKESVLAQTHIVEKGDTFYKISKKYNISIEVIENLNEHSSSNDLKIGSVLQLVATNKKTEDLVVEESVSGANKDVDDEEEEDVADDLIHVVKAKESLYKIAKQHKTTVAVLKDLNPDLGSNLPTGFHLVIKKHSQVDEEVAEVNSEDEENEIAEIIPLNENAVAKANFLIEKASSYIGTRYRSGGTSTAGFDCSGLMCSTFKEIELTLPRTSGSQANFGVKVKRKQANKGDLIFFATNRKRTISHVGMITEVSESEIKFIHSSTSSGVIISSLNEPYYAKRFKQINRVLD